MPNFSYIPFAVIRTPIYPIDRLLSQMADSERNLDLFLSSAEFLELVDLASPELYKETTRQLSKNGSLLPKTRSALFKYFSRACTRCTPFASLASLTTVPIGKELNNIVLGQDVTYNLSLDFKLLYALSQTIPSDQTIYFTNDTIYKVGNYLRYIKQEAESTVTSTKEVKRNSFLEYVLASASKGIGKGFLIHAISNRYSTSEEHIHPYIDELISSGLLIPDTSPRTISDNETQRLLNANLSSAPGLSSIIHDIDSYSTSDNPLIHIETITRIRNKIKDEGYRLPDKNILKLDIYREADKNSGINEQVTTDIIGGLHFLTKLYNYSPNKSFTEFKHRFANRYEDREVLLLEALDSDIGIGYTNEACAIKSSLIDGLILPVKGKTSIGFMPVGETTTLLHRKLQQSIQDDFSTIILKDCDVIENGTDERLLPKTIAAMGSISFHKGTILLNGLHFCGPSAANLLGRFSDNDDILKLVSSICKCEQEDSAKTIHVELHHLPSIRVGNILARKKIRTHQLSFLTPDGNSIPLNDIYIRINNNRLILRAKSLDKEIIPHLTTAHNYRNGTSSIYHFLCDFQSQDIISGISFSWCGLENLYSRLPRVQYKNLILSPAMWIVETPYSILKKASDKVAVFKDWASKLSLPEQVLLVAGDNKLYVNSNSKECIEAFITELPKKGRITLHEYLECGVFVRDENDGSFNNEFIIPLIKK